MVRSGGWPHGVLNCSMCGSTHGLHLLFCTLCFVKDKHRWLGVVVGQRWCSIEHGCLNPWNVFVVC